MHMEVLRTLCRYMAVLVVCAAQLQDLQDENWKMEVFGELEALKQQLSTLNGLEGRLDASESILDATDTPAGRAGRQDYERNCTQGGMVVKGER